MREAFLRFVPTSPDERLDEHLLAVREAIEGEFAVEIEADSEPAIVPPGDIRER